VHPLTAEQIARFAPFASERDLAGGDGLCEAGERNRTLSVVLEGQVEILSGVWEIQAGRWQVW